MESTNQPFTPEQRERALDLYRLHHERRNSKASYVEDPKDLPFIDVRAWLAVEQYILDSFAKHPIFANCNAEGGPSLNAMADVLDNAFDAKADSRIQAWMTVAKHPVFADCYNQTEGALLDAVLAKLDDMHTHTCEQWRPITAAEIQQGWMVRSRRGNGTQATWGVAHHQNSRDDWITEADSLLTFADAGWTYETTAPASAPAPDPRSQVVRDWVNDLC